MQNQASRWTVIIAIVMGVLLPGQANADMSAIYGARRLYPTMARRHWLLAECTKVDPDREAKYREARKSYDQATSALAQRVRAILMADARKSRPGISEQEVLSTFDRWLETTQNKINHDIQSGDPVQFRQQCDYIARPEGRARYHVSRQWDLTLVGLPAEQYPDEVKAVLSWDGKEPR
jgi:hypothetical protein